MGCDFNYIFNVKLDRSVGNEMNKLKVVEKNILMLWIAFTQYIYNLFLYI